MCPYIDKHTKMTKESCTDTDTDMDTDTVTDKRMLAHPHTTVPISKSCLRKPGGDADSPDFRYKHICINVVIVHTVYLYVYMCACICVCMYV